MYVNTDLTVKALQIRKTILHIKHPQGNITIGFFQEALEITKMFHCGVANSLTKVPYGLHLFLCFILAMTNITETIKDSSLIKNKDTSTFDVWKICFFHSLLHLTSIL